MLGRPPTRDFSPALTGPSGSQVPKREPPACDQRRGYFSPEDFFAESRPVLRGEPPRAC